VSLSLRVVRFRFALKRVRATATGNPMKRLPPDRNVNPNLRLCPALSRNLRRSHQPLSYTHNIDRFGRMQVLLECHVLLQAPTLHACLRTAKCCPSGHVPEEHACGCQDILLFCPISTIHSDAVPMYGHLCQDLCTCQIWHAFKLTLCSPVDQCLLHRSLQNTYHQTTFQIFGQLCSL
jgi:hypothetical protein